MGYYVDLIFDTGSVLDWKTAVQKLCAAGAVVAPWEECDPDFLKMHPDRCERLVQLDAPLLPFILVNKDARKGDWATMCSGPKLPVSAQLPRSNRTTL